MSANDLPVVDARSSVPDHPEGVIESAATPNPSKGISTPPGEFETMFPVEQ